MRSFKLLVLATILAAAPACKKTEKAPETTSGSATGSDTAAAGSGSATMAAGSGSATAAAAGSGSAAGSDMAAGSGSATMAAAGSGDGSAAAAAAGSGSAAPAADPNADSIVVLAKHTPAKDGDPVKVVFSSFKITKADFDPKKIEGGKATLEIDPSSLSSGSDKRDAHLKTPDFLDTAKFPTIVVNIDHVKKKADKTYSAEATVKLHDVTKKLPITFDVVDQTADSIRIKSEVPFSRLDFKVGKDPKEPKAAPVETGVVLQAQLTLKKT